MKNYAWIVMMVLAGTLMMNPAQAFAENEGSHMEGSHGDMACPYCEKMGAHMKEHISTLRDAAAALKTSNPDLSEKLSEMADMKEGMMKKGHDHMKGMKSEKKEHQHEGSH
ncbi:MAG: hypothetical protein NUV91_07775 [Candidatus Omnitrophica bacterium]|nr:hypothetical protein [Candidatus Omnitrophota bacterium]